MNKASLKILCLDDNEDDAIIIKEQLRSEGLDFEFFYVSTENEFTDKLKSINFDIILSDYNLPGFSGIAALLIAKKFYPSVPFICISGSMGEDLAVELMQLGAADYILKDRLSKLPVSIQRALKDVEIQQARIDAEIELKESKAKYQSLVEDINDAIFEIDSAGIITYLSPAIVTITGFKSSQYIGKSLFNFIYEKDLPEAQEKFKNIIYKGMINPFEFRISSISGELVWLRTSSKPIIKNGATVCIRGIAVDITEWKLAGDKIRKLSRAIDQSPVSVLITELQGNITYANEAVHKFTGYSNDDLIGKNPRIFRSGETQAETYKTLWETIFSGKEWKGELHNKKKNGQLYWESISISPILNEKGEMTHFLAIKEDITERKKLNSDLLEAKVKAEASDKLKTAFLNNISHEVRTPLNGILGFSELVVQPDIQQEEKESYLEILNVSSERLVNTISNYMDISLIVSGNILVKSKPVDLSLLLENLYEKFLPKCKTKNLEFIRQFPSYTGIHFISDDDLLEKTLSHLLDNAIKFTTNGSITFGGYYNNNEFVLFVKDTGAGIDREAQSKVFQIFMQADIASTRGYEGSGLGLSIAKGLVELMGGRIRMESEKGIGSSFYIIFHDLHGQNLETKSRDKTESKKNTGASPVILIAEDDESNSSLLITILKKASLDYFLALNGEEAVELCHSHPEISLILMDIKMPVMDGLAAARKIKEFRKDLPIVGISAFAMTGDKEKAFEAGCDEYIFKPIKSDLLLSVINKQIGIQ
jgi:PAS domain S-box-containing protein